MNNSTSYTSKDVIVLSDRDHVRLRTALYLGNMQLVKYRVPLFLNEKFEIKELEFVPAVYKAVGEIFDNSIDEFSQIKKETKKLSIQAEPLLGKFTVSDNGRGVPIDKHATGKYTPEVVFSQLRSGRNFKEGKDVGVIGLNGVGSSAVNYTSTEFIVEIDRDGKKYKQKFSNGCETVGKPSIVTTESNKTGTSISFSLDPLVFKNIALPKELMNNRAMELALTNPGISVDYNNEQYKFKKGFDDVIKNISENYFKFEKDNMEFFIIFDVNKNDDEEFFTWINSSLLFDGGVCNSQFINAFTDKVSEHLEKDAKKSKCKIVSGDIKRKLLILANLKISDPQYDSQSKTRLTGPLMKKEFVQLIEEQWSLFARRNKQWLEDTLQYAIKRHSFKEDIEAIKELKNSHKKKIDGLIDCTSKDIFQRRLFITEGLSARAQLTDARNPATDASFALTGKINNVYGSKISEVLNMGKITDLLAVIGLIPGQKAVRTSLKYSKIVISTDADVDGGNILGLVINLFYQFWPELFDKSYAPIVHRLIVPNICLTKAEKRLHFPNRTEYEKVKEKYSGYTVKYYKGLGSMDTKDWEMLLSDQKYLLPILDDGNLKNVLELVFSDNVDKRKEWLTK